MEKKLNKYFGNKAFYSMVLAILVPIVVQNGFTNFVNMLDNVMVGRLGTEEIAGVSIVNQLLFVYNLCIFGIMSGAGIFTAQFVGGGNVAGVRNTFRFKLVSGLILNVVVLSLLFTRGPFLVGLYLTGTADGGDISLTMDYALQYLHIMALGLPFFLMVQCYASTLRENGETAVPMKAGIAAVMVNFVFNWLLIFGKLGFPRLGVRGAAIATVLSRIVELTIIASWTHTHLEVMPFADGVYKTLRIPRALMKKIMTKGAPLFANEVFWSVGIALLNQCYSTRGLNAVAGFNIGSTMNNLCTVVLYANGAAIGIVVGRLLGAERYEEAYDTDRKMIVFSALLSFALSFVFMAVSGLFPQLYNTTPEARIIATQVIMIQALFLPMAAIRNACYYTLRSGGRTIITFCFDSGFVWFINVPTALILSRFTDVGATTIFFYIQLGDLFKAAVGLYLVHRKLWLRKFAR